MGQKILCDWIRLSGFFAETSLKKMNNNLLINMNFAIVDSEIKMLLNFFLKKIKPIGSQCNLRLLEMLSPSLMFSRISRSLKSNWTKPIKCFLCFFFLTSLQVCVWVVFCRKITSKTLFTFESEKTKHFTENNSRIKKLSNITLLDKKNLHFQVASLQKLLSRKISLLLKLQNI